MAHAMRMILAVGLPVILAIGIMRLDSEKDPEPAPVVREAGNKDMEKKPPKRAELHRPRPARVPQRLDGQVTYAEAEDGNPASIRRRPAAGASVLYLGDLEKELASVLATEDQAARLEALRALAAKAAGDPEIARALLDSMTERNERANFALAVSTALGDVSLQAAADWTLELPGRLKNIGLAHLGPRWAKEDVGEAIKWAEGLSGPDQIMAIRTVMQTWRRQEPTEAAQWAANLAKQPGADAMSDIIAAAWAGVDREAAYNWVLTIDDVKVQSRALAALTREVVADDLESAAEWVLDFPKGNARRQAVNLVTNELSRRDPAAAAAWLGRLEDDKTRSSAVYSVARHWAKRDPAAASEWINELEDASMRAEAAPWVGRTWAEKDVHGAAEWALNIEEPGLRDQVAVGIAEVWARKEPQAATEWAQQFPEGKARNDAVVRTVRQWAVKEPETAANWATDLGAADKAVTPVTTTVAVVWANKEPANAAAWLDTIDSQRARDSAAFRVYGIWAKTDEAAARRWLEESKVSERTKGQILGKR